MFKSSKLSLKNSFSIIFGFQIILVIALGLMILLLFQNQNNLAKSRDAHTNSYRLADELRQSSDDLTRLVRSYVATGNPEFEREYWAVLDIRNGKIPRPQEYNRIYWDFVSADGQKPRPDGETISLHDLMVKAGFTEAEFAKLQEAQKNSDGLVKAETIAMNAIKGLFDDGNGNFTVKKEPDFKLASDLVNNEAYYKTKAEIMRPIDEFYVMLEERTNAAVAKYLNLSGILFWSIIILVGCITLMFLLTFFVIRQQISKREQSEKELADLNDNLEKNIKERTAELEKMNKMMVNRELKMIELKKQIDELKNKKT